MGGPEGGQVTTAVAVSDVMVAVRRRGMLKEQEGRGSTIRHPSYQILNHCYVVSVIEIAIKYDFSAYIRVPRFLLATTLGNLCVTA
jgi:hypothetical protein